MTSDVYFVTGATGLLGGRVLQHLLGSRAGTRAYLLVRDAARMEEAIRRLRIPRERVVLLPGDLLKPGLGLEATARRRLRREVTATVHLAADTVFSRSLDGSRATNVGGTRRLLELAADWVGPLHHVSTAFVAGRRTGRVFERDPGGQYGWVNAYEQSKWEAEALVRSSGLDFSILRPSTIVCDSVAGEVTQYNAVHRALRLFQAGLAPMLPGRETAPVDFVTADYAASAIGKIAARREASGETYHLCAGEGAIPLGEMLDLTLEIWSRDVDWRRRSIARPALTDLATYRLFEESVNDVADIRLRRVTRSLSHFVPQLALEKRFDTAGADAVLGRPAPPVRDYWRAMVEHLVRTDATGGPARFAA